MRDFRFILGRRALIVFLALLIATGALLGMPAATRTLAGTGDGWRDLNPLTPSPTARTYHAMATLPGGNVLLFGGLGDSGRRNDTWLFNTANNAWGLLDTGSASPSKRLGHAMAKTSSGVLLFGGFDSSLFNDTWLFNASTSTWGLLDTGSASPTKRFLHAMATLPTGDVLLFGGWDSGGTFRNDTWLFNASTSTWGLLDTGSASPSARNAHAMAKTSSGVLLFGGNDGTINLLNDTWLFTYD
ncbi:MAG: hypothetical protein NTU59_02320, partial [Coprothermobacterota bacterium]|nr:hypothetical protein [Coprothermobacterota bacterium]